jgi:shikimate kinase
MELREPLYQEVADMVVDTYRRSPKTVSQEIYKQLKVELGGSQTE